MQQLMAGVYFKASEIVETLDEYGGRKGRFIKTFGLNDIRNKNGWRAVWEGIKKNIHTFKGRPGIEFMKCDADGCDLDHTEAQTKELSLKIQEPYRKTTIIDWPLDEANRTAYFIHEVHDDQFWEDVKSGKIKFVSPSIWPKAGGYEVIGTMENGLPMIDVWDWDGLHEAYVNKPAFGDDAKITAACEGIDCPVKLLSAKEHQRQLDKWDKSVSAIVLHADAVQDCVTRKINNYGQHPDDQKLAIFFSECRKSLGGIVDQGDMQHLQEIPLLIQHNKKKRFISVSPATYKAVAVALSAGEKVDELKVFEIIHQEKSHSSFSSCTCSASHTMSPEEEKDMKSKLQAAEHDKEELQSKFTAMEEEEVKDSKARVARLVAHLKGMDDEDKMKAHIVAIKACDDPKEAKAMEEAEKEVKTAKKGMEHDPDKPESGMEHENKDMKARIIELETNEAKPLVAMMVKARELKGADEDTIKAFVATLEEKPLKEIKSLYANEQILIEGLVGKENPEAELKHFNFGNAGQAFSAKSMDVIFSEEVPNAS